MKRTAEKSTIGDEPVKKKSPKLNDKQKKEKVPFAAKKFNGAPASKHGAKKFPPKGKDGKFAAKPNFKAAKSAPVETAATEKTDWRKLKEEKKQLKMKRKQAKDCYEVSIEAKQIYEKLKSRHTEKKQELVEKLYRLIGSVDTIKKLVMAHDTARIIQCMLKFAVPTLREKISENLLPLAVGMATSKYSHFCVMRMFKYGSPTVKSKLVDSFMGHIVKLACHTISSKILDHIYLTVANDKQRAYMRQEFYGDLYKNSKDDGVRKLEDAYKESPNMKASFLGSVKANLEHVANKQLVDSSLVHSVMLEYLNVCEDDKIEETVSAFAPLTPLMLTTKDGCQAAITVFYKSSTKNRRAIIKIIKEHLVKICTHEHGYIFMLAVINALDDTKAIKKAIYDVIHPELHTLMANQWGRRVIEWLIAPADTNCFHPTFIKSIEFGLEFGKKDKIQRRKEIFEQIERPISEAINEQPNFWISDRHISLVTADILRKLSTKNFVLAATALAVKIAEPNWSVSVEQDETSKKGKKVHDVEKIIADATKQKKKLRGKLPKVVEGKQPSAKATVEDTPSDDDKDDKSEDENVEDKSADEEIARITIAGIEEAGLHVVLKRILKNDKDILANNADATETFGAILVKQLSPETIKRWIGFNRACFVMLNILETNNEDTKAALKRLLEPELAALKKQEFTGAKLLIKKLAL